MVEDPTPTTGDDSEKDEYPPDTEFGRQAAEDQERADEMAREGAPEESFADEPVREPRAGGKAEPEGEDEDGVDEASRESFPASDPPSSGRIT